MLAFKDLNMSINRLSSVFRYSLRAKSFSNNSFGLIYFRYVFQYVVKIGRCKSKPAIQALFVVPDFLFIDPML